MSSTAAQFEAPASGLLATRYESVAANTIDYWMLPDEAQTDPADVLRAVRTAPVLDGGTVSIYVHVPFCAQRCAFCAFSGGNSLDFRQAERYAALVSRELVAALRRANLLDHPIRAVNVGGGAPELLGEHVGTVLGGIRALSGCTDETEIGVELTLSTARRPFVEELVRWGVTKASFGVQSLDPDVRRFMRQPGTTRHLEQVLDWIDGRIPVVNADLITGLPGSTLGTVARDLAVLMSEPRIHALSSYLLTAAAAPALVALTESERIPPRPDETLQALMRLHTYSTLQRAGWVRRGTNTYVDPRRVPADVLPRLTGHECIGAPDYESFLIGVGPQAVSSLPGARVENRVDLAGWARAVEADEAPYHLPKCSTAHQKDIGLWCFPLRWEGLPRERFERMLASGALSVRQLATFEALVDEGLVFPTAKGWELSILGEVFMGHLVRDLKKDAGRRAVDEYVAEGRALGRAITNGRVSDKNPVNNRQIAAELLAGDTGDPDDIATTPDRAHAG